ncbi:MAG: aminodeoxychorismate/anthranilate synthase component II [Rhodothermales bacterium]|nr:aminodeoxychorismate/anthranilate synthase component II [Rhodothermales bacterium]
MILVVDNYDSFTYNLVHLVAADGRDPMVVRNDKIDIAEIRNLDPDAILISPGPGRPENAGISKEVIRQLGSKTPILGVCLGHQAIGEVYGAKVTYAPTLMHGKTSTVSHDGLSIFEDIEQDFVATRYHSLVVDPETITSNELIVTARTGEVVMGLRHKSHPVEGIQFHPESVLTIAGPQIIRNWLKQVDLRTRP